MPTQAHHVQSGHVHLGHDPASHDHHSHGHAGHGHGHHGRSHAPANFDRAFAIGVTLNLVFVLLQGFYGVLAHSLAALANAGLLMATVGAIAVEAVRRLQSPESFQTIKVVVVAAIGIAINGATALMFMSGRKDDLNIRGAFVHMLSDAAVSASVVVAAAAIAVTDWFWLDPVVSLAIVAVIALGTVGLLKASVGPVTYSKNQNEVVLGNSVTRSQSVSEDTAQIIANELRKLIDTALSEAKRVLREHRGQLDAVAKGLLAYQSLSGAEISGLMAGRPLTREPDSGAPQI